MFNNFKFRPHPMGTQKTETGAYHKLKNDGGNPIYSLDQLNEIFQSPSSRFKVQLQPWQKHPNSNAHQEVFASQWHSWQAFRKFQNDIRGLGNNNSCGYAAYVEKTKHHDKKDSVDCFCAKSVADSEPYELYFWWDWDITNGLCDWHQSLYAEHKGGGFSDYVEAVKQLLARLNFEQQLAHQGFTGTVVLDQDPKKQDKVTTWIEYLNFECWWLDKHISDTERLQLKYDRLWQDLKDKKIPRLGENKDCFTLSSYKQYSELAPARAAMHKVESEVERIHALAQTDPKQMLMLEVSREKLLTTKRLFKKIRGEIDLVKDFIAAQSRYKVAKQLIICNLRRVQWILDEAIVFLTEEKSEKDWSRTPI